MEGFKIGSSVDTCTAADLAIEAECMEELVELVLTDPPPVLAGGVAAAVDVAVAGRFLESFLAALRELEPEDQASLEAGGGGNTLLATTVTCRSR